MANKLKTVPYERVQGGEIFYLMGHQYRKVYGDQAITEDLHQMVVKVPPFTYVDVAENCRLHDIGSI